MTTLTERLNFSQQTSNPSAIKLHNRNRGISYYYDNLCLYCADNDIDLGNVSDDEFMAAAEVMSGHGTLDLSTDHYFFWIDEEIEE